MTLSRACLALFAAALLATAACAPVATDVTRLSTQDAAGCRFVSTNCGDLHNLRNSVW